MDWLRENQTIWRAAALAVIVLALIGPWAFDLIHVPAEYDCSAPFVRLEGDYCGAPVAGMQMFALFFGSIFQFVGQVFSGAGPAEYWREFLAVAILFLLALPFFTTFLMLWQRERRGLRWVNLSAWGTAAALLLLALLLESNPALWGIWLYRVLAVLVLILEIVILPGGRPAGSPGQPLDSTSEPWRQRA